MDESYGTVTNPQRYSVLHDEALDIVGRLTTSFVVDRTDGLHVDEDLAQRGDVGTLIRLSPARGGARPLTVALTRFPGLLVRFGHWHVEAYPACGCDVCDERPDDLVEQFREKVDVLVGGGFTETLTTGRYPWLVHDFSGRAGRAHGSRRLDHRQARLMGGPARILGRPWSNR